MNRAEQIAQLIGERIASGRLRAGDRAPSARAIMRDHSVAMGTATRVLGLLQADGLIDSAPGRGSVVINRPAVRAHRASTTLDDLLARAIGIADAESLAAVSIRRLAGELGLATMSVYRYVSGREQLETAMLDRVLAEIPNPAASTQWRAELDAALRGLWDAMLRHPWLAGALSMTRPAVLPNAMPVSEAILGPLRRAGFDRTSAFTEYLCLFNLVRGLGLTIEPELADRAETGITNDEWMDTQLAALRAATPPDRFPAMADVLAHPYPYDAQVLFDNAVQRYLDGLGARVASMRS